MTSEMALLVPFQFLSSALSIYSSFRCKAYCNEHMPNSPIQMALLRCHKIVVFFETLNHLRHNLDLLEATQLMNYHWAVCAKGIDNLG